MSAPPPPYQVAVTASAWSPGQLAGINDLKACLVASGCCEKSTLSERVDAHAESRVHHLMTGVGYTPVSKMPNESNEKLRAGGRINIIEDAPSHLFGVRTPEQERELYKLADTYLRAEGLCFTNDGPGDTIPAARKQAQIRFDARCRATLGKLKLGEMACTLMAMPSDTEKALGVQPVVLVQR